MLLPSAVEMKDMCFEYDILLVVGIMRSSTHILFVHSLFTKRD